MNDKLFDEILDDSKDAERVHDMIERTNYELGIDISGNYYLADNVRDEGYKVESVKDVINALRLPAETAYYIYDETPIETIPDTHDELLRFIQDLIQDPENQIVVQAYKREFSDLVFFSDEKRLNAVSLDDVLKYEKELQDKSKRNDFTI